MPLSAKQIESYAKADSRYSVWVGAVSSGKTYISLLKLVDLIKNGPKGDCMIMGVSRETIQRNVLGDLYRFLGFPVPNNKINETMLYGRRVYFVGCHNEGAVKRIQGSTLAIAYVDEGTCIPEPFFKMLQSRLRIPGAQALITCNPEGPTHWMKKDLIDRSQDLNVNYWNFCMDDNPFLTEEYKEAMKKEYTGMWYQRYILGEWACATGAIYDTFDDDNLYDFLPFPAQFKVAGIDYGTVNATCCLLAAINTSHHPQIRIEKEFYYDQAVSGRIKPDSDQADDIENFLKYEKIQAVYIDPAAASLKIELSNRGLPIVDAVNDVLPGIQTVSKFVAGKNLAIHRSCTNLIDQMYSYQWDSKLAAKGKDFPKKEKDHSCDALRYIINSTFPTGQFSDIGQTISIDKLRKYVYGENEEFLYGNDCYL